jgi:hypothetical protein
VRVRFTLAFDESGNFDAIADTPLVMGGVLVPGDAAALDARFRSRLKSKCKALGIAWPPQPNMLASEQRAELLGVAIEAVTEASGRWVFVVGRVPHQNETPFAHYMYFAHALASLSLRFARVLGATELDVKHAQRSLMIDRQGLRDFESAGLSKEALVEHEGVRARGLSQADLRLVLEAANALQITSVEVVSSEAGAAHASLTLAGVGCNALLRGLRGGYEALVHPWTFRAESAPWIVRLEDALAMNRIDDALGAGHLVFANELMEPLRSDAVAKPEAPQIASYKAADDLLRLRLDAFAKTPSSYHMLSALLAADARGRLEVKTGTYEGTWRALAQAWFSNKNALAIGMREKVSDRQRRARLYRLVAECANLRGDVVNTEKAAVRFEAELSHGVSLSLLAETLVVRNLRVVAVQSALPASNESIDAVTERLTQATELLRDTVAQATTLVSLASSLAKDATSALPAEEAELWTLLGQPVPESVIQDRELGRCLETIARSFAFLGRHDQAVRAALAARSHFQGDGFDLRINANNMSRILLDACRGGGAAGKQDEIAKALRLAGVSDLAVPEQVILHLAEAPALRFSVDLLLRAILFCPLAVDIMLMRSWTADLDKGAGSQLYMALSGSVLRSYPSELVARHAGETCTDDASKRAWLELARELSRTAGGTSTLHRLEPFTTALLQGVPASGKPGSLQNPTFEHR